MNRLKLAGAALFFTISSILTVPIGAHAKAPAEEPIYFSIDLDGTLFDTIHDMRQVETDATLIRASDGLHQPVHGAAAFIQSLLEIPNAKIVFFSGGEAERNKELLSKLIMKDGKSALDHAFKVLSKEDLTPVDPGKTTGEIHSHDRFKKDLRKIAPGIDLRRVVHIDDIPDFVLHGQEKNVVAINPDYDYVENYSRLKELERQGLTLKRPPPSRKHWAYDTQRLTYARGVIEEALDLTRRREDYSLRDAIERMQHGQDPRRFLDAGNKVLSRYTRDHSRFVTEKPCPNLVRNLSGMLEQLR